MWAVGASDLALFAPHLEVAQDAGGDEGPDQQPGADAGDEASADDACQAVHDPEVDAGVRVVDRDVVDGGEDAGQRAAKMAKGSVQRR